MGCSEVNTLDAALKKIPSSVLPIDGLRRDSEGNLTKDALTMIVDGLKSRGIDPTDPDTKKKLLNDLNIFLCSVNNQYQFLIRELMDKSTSGQVITKEFVNTVKDKNITMQDVLNTSRYLTGIQSYTSESEFIEGWQNMTSTNVKENFSTTDLQDDMTILDSNSYVGLRKHMVKLSEEKNKVASNYLGLYGFLNLVAIGLLIYVSAAPKSIP